MSKIYIGKVGMPTKEWVVSRNAFLGITRSGKTFAAKGIAEQLIEAGIPIIVFDAIGMWRYLKVPGSPNLQNNPKGFPIVVAGGLQPDLPLNPHTAPQIVRAAIQQNINLVIDLYDPKLSKADWRRIVQDCFQILLFENKGLRHIFLEEAAEYVPQANISDPHTYAAVEKLARMGGNASLGITFINPRPQELNKAVLELCDNIVLLRQRGKHAIDSLQKQMEKLSPTMAKQIADELPQMSQGDCWVFTEKDDVPVRTRTTLIQSFHPDRLNPEANPTAGKAVDTKKFVQALAGNLEKVIEEAKANDPVELKREIHTLKADIIKLTKQLSVTVVPSITDDQKRAIEHALKEIHDAALEVNNRGLFLEARARNIKSVISKISGTANTAGREGSRVAPTNASPNRVTPLTPVKRQVPPTSNGDEPLPKGAGQILIAAAQYPDGVTDSQVAVLTGYKRTSRVVYKQQLAQRGYIENTPNGFRATPAGIAALGDRYEALPTGPALQNYWEARLSGGELMLFQHYVEAYPNDISNEEMMEKTGYKRTSIVVYRQKLAARNLIVGNKASEELF